MREDQKSGFKVREKYPLLLFRIKHKSTGLYFCPSRSISVKTEDGRREWVKSNLSKKGKVYIKYPSLKWCESIYDHTQLLETLPAWGSYRGWKSVHVKTPPECWEVVVSFIDD